MNMQGFNSNNRVRIIGDKNLLNTDLYDMSGIIVDASNVLIDVIITSGNCIGQKHRFLKNQLEKIS